MLAAFAGVTERADDVNALRHCFMGFGQQGAVTHRARGEGRGNGMRRLHLIQGYCRFCGLQSGQITGQFAGFRGRLNNDRALFHLNFCAAGLETVLQMCRQGVQALGR